MTSTLIALIFGALLILIIINMLATAIIAHKYVETIEEQLPNCSSVQTIREAWLGGGLLGKIMRGGVISVVLMVPKLSARRGIIDAMEVERLPAFYKKLLIIPTAVNFVLFMAMITLRIIGHFSGL